MTVCPPSLTAPTLAASIRTRKGHIRFFSPFLPPLSSFATPQFGPISSVAFHLVQCDKGYDRDVWSRYAENLASQHGCLSTQVLTCMPSERAEQHDARWRTVGCSMSWLRGYCINNSQPRRWLQRFLQDAFLGVRRQRYCVSLSSTQANHALPYAQRRISNAHEGLSLTP
ncbi:hypothetical protein BJV77DRAFT_434059 [Russula vinacea]|nr:hypothetical protein BJV77DRAFT_434059 [Russula vinacea]